MRPRTAFLATQSWGAVCGAILGAHRTREAALHLLNKNKAIQAAGLPALPGVGHLEMLASRFPDLAGALFYGLSFGLGWGTLLALWASGVGRLPGPWRRLTWTVTVLPLWAAWAGDAGLALTLLAMCLAVIVRRPGSALGAEPRAVGNLVLVAVVATGLIPWAVAPEGAFTRFRDRLLLRRGVGLALDEFYYRWTLFPAEALKPVAAKSQPVAFFLPTIEGGETPEFCAQALSLRILCIPQAASGADFQVVPYQDGVLLQKDGVEISWPRERESRSDRWMEFSRMTDEARPLRKLTAVALFVGVPTALCCGLAALSSAFGARIPAQRWRLPGSTACAALIAGALWAGSVPDPHHRKTLEELRAPSQPSWERVASYLASERPIDRFYAAFAAGRFGQRAIPLLLEALSDPVINVRYAAAQSLGAVGGARARAALLEVLANPEAWYVKEKAYAALWRMGWRPL